MSKNFCVILVNSVHAKEFLVQICRVDKKNVKVSEFSTFLECQLIKDVLYVGRYRDQISRDLAEFVNQQPYQKAGLFARLCTDAPAYLPPDVLPLPEGNLKANE